VDAKEIAWTQGTPRADWIFLAHLVRLSGGDLQARCLKDVIFSHMCSLAFAEKGAGVGQLTNHEKGLPAGRIDLNTERLI